jgi:arylsulfatase
MEVHAAMVDRMDQEIGRVVDSLREAGELDDTLILFLSDNGASAERILRGDGHDPDAPPGSARSYLCLEPGWANLANAPFRKSKIFTHEGGISTPLIAHWPAGIAAKGELRTTPGHLIDLAPTFLDLAEIPAPDSWEGLARPPLPGTSLVPAFATNAEIPREPVYYKHQGNRALRSGTWKIVASGPDSPWELYDLAADRSETTDLSARHPEKVEELSALWHKLDEEFDRREATAGPRPS